MYTFVDEVEGLRVTLEVRLIIIILLAAVPVFLLQIFHDIEVRKDRTTEILKRAETLVELVTARQARIVEGARLLLAATSHLQSIREKNPEECHRRLRDIAEQVEELTAAAVLDTKGERWCVSLPSSGPINLADRHYFQETLRTGTMQTSDFIIGRQTGQGSLAFTYPQRGDAGAIESIVFVAYRTSVLSRLLNDPPLPEGAVAAIVDREGVVAARWPQPGQWVGKNLSSSDIVRKAVAERRGLWRGTADWAGDDEYVFAFAPMPSPTSLTVLVGLPLSALLKDVDAIFWSAVSWTTLIFLLAALVAILGTHLTVVRPIRELHKFADALSGGDFEAPHSRIGGVEEVRSLGQHFEAMARSLGQRQSQLMEALQQKELLLKEVNHRVKNSLQLVASLFGLQRATIKDPETRRQFEEAGRRINTVAQIHQRLYQDEHVDRVAFDKFLQELCSDLNAAAGGKHSLVCDAEPCHLPTDQIIPAALIANELITNAFKYSYPAGAAGLIRVDCRRQGNAVVLSVSDDGAPLPEDFDPATSSGLGMKLMVGLAKQLRATLEVLPRSRGKSFVLRMPLEPVVL
jgi:two-component sensor histidine kinase